MCYDRNYDRNGDLGKFAKEITYKNRHFLRVLWVYGAQERT
jgi:hypothetical protein